ncbi:MAG: protein-L-isoaspartate O-methyltransferase [Desulfobacteraceae bacterium]|nr:protein-L-isoaspartate O-methyltransferase [Desulfobacteraceae bacterium]
MPGWIVPPPKKPTKSKEEFEKERFAKVKKLGRQGYLRSRRIRDALLRVPREDFILPEYRDYAYLEVPLPLPGENATISCPHSYPLFYEPLGLDEGHKFLEVGLGSGYGSAVAREVVGPDGFVVSIEIDPVTFEFARRNLEYAGYKDIIVVRGDGGLGYPDLAPYDRICVTAACVEVPPLLMDQLKVGGKFIAPLVEGGIQYLVMLEKEELRVRRRVLCEVLYVSLRGICGSSKE